MSEPTPVDPPAPAGAPAALLEKLRELVVELEAAADKNEQSVAPSDYWRGEADGWAKGARHAAAGLQMLLADPAGWDVHGYEHTKPAAVSTPAPPPPVPSDRACRCWAPTDADHQPGCPSARTTED